jgi:membrane associated rhomboid family serine protease
LSRTCVWQVVLGIVLLGGTLLWLCGRGVNHIGASGLISGLIVFLVVRGCLLRRFRTVVIAIVTFFLYGGTLMWGIIPGDPLVSWDGHLCGALAGGLVAFGLARWSWNRQSPRCVAVHSA